MTPKRVHWKTVDRETFDSMVSVLISRLHPSVQRIDGSGGDGGRDPVMRTDEGLVIYQLKSFSDRMGPTQRRQVKRSLERASRHGPVGWRLVAPIEPTIGEWEWFERLIKQYPFRCVWYGRTWLDSEMAQKPEIARYYLHGGESEVVALLRSVAPEAPALQQGAAHVAVQRVGEIVSRLNDVDPHYAFDISARYDGSLTVVIIPRYQEAERDRSPVRVRFAFPDTAEGVHARQTFQKFVDYGTPCVVPPDYIAELWLDVPAGLGAALEGYELSLGPRESDPPEGIEAVLRAIDQQGSVVAQLALETTAATQGLRGLGVTFQDSSRSLIVQMSFDDHDRTGMMRLQYQHPYEFSPLELLPPC